MPDGGRILRRMEEQVRAWFAWAWGALAVLSAVAVVAVPRCLVTCDATLVPVREPSADWRAWPLADPEVARRRACPRASILGDALTTPPPSGPETWIRRDPTGDIFVVALVPRREEAPAERFASAFRRERGRRMSFSSPTTAACSLAIGLALAAMIAGLGVARRRIRAATRLANDVREAYAALAPDVPTYRGATVPGVTASSDAHLTEGARRATRALGTAFAAVATLLGIFVVCAGYFVVRAWMRVVL